MDLIGKGRSECVKTNKLLNNINFTVCIRPVTFWWPLSLVFLRPCCFTVVVFHIAVTRDAVMMSYTTPVRCLWKTVKLTVLIYTLSSKGAELAFIWSHDCGHCLIKLAICPIAIQLGAHPQAVIGKSRTNAFLVQPIGGATNTKKYTFGLHVIEGEY